VGPNIVPALSLSFIADTPDDRESIVGPGNDEQPITWNDHWPIMPKPRRVPFPSSVFKSYGYSTDIAFSSIKCLDKASILLHTVL